MKNLPIVLCLLLLLQIQGVFAQCSFSVTATSTESRCRESGSIVVNGSPYSASFIYEIVSGPRTAAASSNNTFLNLPAGNYVVRTTRNGCSVDKNVTVAGNYSEPGLLLTKQKNIACPSGTGCITALQPSNGRAPYSYALISGPQTRPAQSTPEFCGLPAGQYTLQAFDSCGVVRTTNVTLAIDTGDFVAYTYGYSLQHANCTDLIVCPTTGFSKTSSHTQMMIWYVTPTGDTLKANGYEYPVKCDTLVGYSHTYGNWQMLAYDTCGRMRKSNFTFNRPGIDISLVANICGGYQVHVGNAWKYGVSVGYRVYKCSNNALVYDFTESPQTSYFSPTMTLEFDTCYRFVHYNSCGETLTTTYTRKGKPAFNIFGCDAPGCSKPGTGSITLWQTYQSATGTIRYTILSGPERVGETLDMPTGYSWVNYKDLQLGTYTIGAVDECGERDTVTVVVDNPLIRNIQVTQVENCSGGADLHVKITSNFQACLTPTNYGGADIYVTAVSPGYTPTNVVSTPTTANAYSNWEADYLSVKSNSLLLRLYNPFGCTFDTVIAIRQYQKPVLSGVNGYVCSANGTGVLMGTLTGGRAPFSYRIREVNASTWGDWQSGLQFSNVHPGQYQVEVRDACPNGSINVFTFTEWQASPIRTSSMCVSNGSSLTLSADPAIDGVAYEWQHNGVSVGMGPSLVISNYQDANGGQYTLRQVFPGAVCVDQTSINYYSCSVLPAALGDLSGHIVNGNVVLNWKTFQENEPGYFTIERINNDQIAKQVHTMQAKGLSNGSSYVYAGEHLAEGQAWYRVVYTTQTGRQMVSNTIRLKEENGTTETVGLSPVPFSDNLKVALKAKVAGLVYINVYNVGGRLLYTHRAIVNEGLNNILLPQDRLSILPAGIYFVEIKTVSGVYREKAIKL
ncbi:MAG: T9SS type A sorting domain-containing protein [Bacteroidetes bacterium]|nr:T9SS type A sorting domain-containing protein [Bacteroidota bacterium]